MSNVSSSSDTDSQLEEESFKSGDVVWARDGRIWYPVKVLTQTEVPHRLQGFRLINLTHYIFTTVIWYGEDNFTTISVQHVNHLIENKLDPTRSYNMQLLYQEALADLTVE
ncbi:unnamed protein product [Lepeophtheirus salmonis]|uniref:(salmon louse) hypothetical protein n=1 Tax=Lepeophtheirus salmonis TaxID=72036 RepID=A0A7R8HA03_LEPSM|nr:unnamed protein product [Lepeophtheirus salmonis]CAF2969033.1 unnamed protein product [Lepeophtheirus salmonis]